MQVSRLLGSPLSESGACYLSENDSLKIQMTTSGEVSTAGWVPRCPCMVAGIVCQLDLKLLMYFPSHAGLFVVSELSSLGLGILWLTFGHITPGSGHLLAVG